MVSIEEKFSVLQKVENKELSTGNLGKAKNELNNLRETVKVLQNSANELEGNLQSIDAVGLLENIERQITVFVNKYTTVLDMLADSAGKEVLFLEKITGKIESL